MAKAKKPNAGKTRSVGPVGDLEGRMRTEPAPGNFIRHWRVFRGIANQGELAKLTVQHDPAGKGINRVGICRLESGEARYNEDHITLLAKTLQVAPRDLIGTNPYDSGDIFAVYAGLTAADKKRAAKLIAALKR